VDEDYPARLESRKPLPNETIVMAQNRLFWRLMCMFGAMHS